MRTRSATYPDRATAQWCKRSVESGDVPAPVAPWTHGEWYARFGELGPFLGGWFLQDMPDEFGDDDAAVRDCRATVDPQLTARLFGEIHELNNPVRRAFRAGGAMSESASVLTCAGHAVRVAVDGGEGRRSGRPVNGPPVGGSWFRSRCDAGTGCRDATP
ncbi:contact-dependent growth inhibition system immunity protein [Streptomyces yangpuensis]|uniref:contact-dependent growth inhibition system immunity protein n=1 Tax=Streptomyces yangpuensis TaxID=1648182 RepID=UPI003813538B